MKNDIRTAMKLWSVATAMLLSASGSLESGTVVSGRDQASLRLPLGLPVADYANTGYRMEVDGGEARVTVMALPRSQRTPFTLPPAPGESALDPVTRLARSVTAGAASRDEAGSRILAWLSRNVRYALDRSAPQDAESVLTRREGYCTGVARLAVALFQAVGIEAREVPGWIAEGGGSYHRWIEVYDLAAGGWTFSDPLRHHGYVPATYVRLSAETVSNAVAEGGAVIERQQHLVPIDRQRASAAGVRQVSSGARTGASLRVAVAGAPRGEARLEGAGWRRSLELVGGEALFASLPAGSYQLVIALADGGVLGRRLELRGRVRAEMLFPAMANPAVAAGAAAAAAAGAVGEDSRR